jgi:serine/threonine protein kinase
MLQTPNTTNASAYVPPTDPIAPLRAALRGHYDIEREIGQGAFATVYLARDLKHERKVAVKVLNADPTSDIGELRFIREIRTLARLQHPNILPLHDSGHVEAMLYYVMPYVSGDTVRDRIDREKQMSIEAACSIARDVADALAYAHAQGIIHRDIKPENILLSTGHPILADFGIARAIDLAGVRQLTRTGAASPGTPAYMSPEQLMGDKELDGRSDTYSLGCVLFEMVTGKPPFAGKEGFVKRFTEPPPRASTLRKGLPDWLDEAIEKALQREPRDRYPTAKEFVAALSPPVLETSAAGAPVNRRVDASFSSPTQAEPSVARERVGQWRDSITSNHGLMWFAAAAVAVSAIIAGVASSSDDWSRILGRTPPPDPTKIVILPLRGEPTRGEVIARNLRESLTKWQGLYVVSDLELADAMRGTTLTSLKDARTIARSLNAGKLIWGQVASTPDSGRVRVELYDLSSGRAVPPRSYAIQSDTHADQSYSDAAITLMKDPDRPAAADGGDRGTRSYRAWLAYGAGHIALARWDLPSALQAFKESVIADPNYAAARLWLAQVAAWKARDATVSWKVEARRALTGRSTFSLRDSLLGEGLAALAEGRFPQACASYRRLTSVDSSDFAGWYGLGECQSLDQVVIPDRKSPSGMRFRSSYHSAVLDYQRAFRVAPETHSWLPSSQLERLLPATPTLVRFGQNASGAYFMAYPSLSADTIAFVPYPEVTFAAALPPAAMETLGAALDRNSEIRRDIALEWVRVSPENADAHEVLADVLESRGDLTGPGKNSLSAMSALRRAEELASSDAQKLRLQAREVRLLFKLGNFAEARTRADSVLARYDGGNIADARELAPVAAMVGKIGKLAQFVRSGELQTASVNIPAPLQEIGANFFSRAALGVCDDGLGDSRQLLEQQLDSYIAEENRREVRAALEWRPLSLAAPCSGGRSALEITAPEDRLYRMQQSFARGNLNSVRETFNEVARTRRGMRAGDISLDYTYQEAWLRAAIGDTVQAIKTLSLALNALPTLSAAALKEPAAAAAAGRAMMLAADLASAAGDKRSARRWAGAVADLWKDADPALQPSVSRMKALHNKSGAQ